ncbi:MAG: hypothetical protein AB4050_10035 [Synechococcus sp.]
MASPIHTNYPHTRAPAVRLTSIRIVLPLMIVVPLAVSASILEYLALKGGHAAVTQVARSLGQQVRDRSLDSILNYLEKPLLMLQVATNAAASDNLSVGQDCQAVSDVDRCLDQVEQFLAGQVVDNTFPPSMLFASTEGVYTKLEQVTGGGYRLEQLREVNTPRQFFTSPDPNEFDWIRDDRDANTNVYNPINRPWFRDAIAYNRLILGEVYQFARTQEPGITASVPLRDSGNRLLGVLAIDLPLERLSAALAAIVGEITPGDAPSAHILVRYGTGRGEAIPSATEPPDELKYLNCFTRNECSPDRDRPMELDVNGIRYLVASSYLEKPEEWEEVLPDKLMATVIVPKSVVVDTLNENFMRLAVIALGLVVVTAVLGVIASTRWIAIPISRLGQAARDIEANQFDPKPIDGLAERTDELGQLAKLFRRMGMAIDRRMSGFSEEIEHLQALNQEFAAERERNSLKDATHYRSLIGRSKTIRNRSKRS